MIQSPYATSLTRTGKLDMKNKKPYRNALQKKMADGDATKTDGGFYSSNVPVSYHPK